MTPEEIIFGFESRLRFYKPDSTMRALLQAAINELRKRNEAH
jgi:hypothetical protein